MSLERVLYRNLLRCCRDVEKLFRAGHSIEKAVLSAALRDEFYEVAVAEVKMKRMMKLGLQKSAKRPRFRKCEGIFQTFSAVRPFFEAPLIDTEYNQIDLGFRLLRRSTQHIATLKHVEESGAMEPVARTPEVEYCVGEVLNHRYYGQVVVVAWDPQCKESEEWIRVNKVDSQLRHGRRQPFYYTLCEDESLRYCSQENLSRDPKPKRIRHPLLFDFFRRFEDNKYVPRELLLARFPDDEKYYRELREKVQQQVTSDQALEEMGKVSQQDEDMTATGDDTDSDSEASDATTSTSREHYAPSRRRRRAAPAARAARASVEKEDQMELEELSSENYADGSSLRELFQALEEKEEDEDTISDLDLSDEEEEEESDVEDDYRGRISLSMALLQDENPFLKMKMEQWEDEEKLVKAMRHTSPVVARAAQERLKELWSLQKGEVAAEDLELAGEAIIEGDLKFARKAVRKLQRHYPDWTEVLHKRAMLLQAEGKSSKAIQFCNEALRRKPYYFPALMTKAQAALLSQRLGTARSATKKLLHLVPSCDMAQHLLTLVQDFESQKTEKAPKGEDER